MAEQTDSAHERRPDLKADVLAALFHALNRIVEMVHKAKATRQQHILFRVAELTAVVETATALVDKVVQGTAVSAETDEYLSACCRVNVALAAQSALTIAGEILYGSGIWVDSDARQVLDSVGFDPAKSQAGLMADFDTLLTRI
jgi:alkylation response protein AidB-like acyl-CoA dehydrogenase